MVSRVKTDMPCCYQHKTLNITGNGTQTVSKKRKEREGGKTEREEGGGRALVSVKESVGVARATNPSEIR